MKALLFALLSLVVFTQSAAAQSDSLRVGDPAPDFTLAYATKDSVSRVPLTLSSLKGKGSIVLAFYPADWSGGCTKEVCDMRDNFTALSGVGAQVIGISGDNPYSHYEWAKHHNLPFGLVSDTKHEVSRRYSSFDEKSGYSRRTVYAIDKSGKIAYIDLKYSPRDATSLNKLQDALKTMQ